MRAQIISWCQLLTDLTFWENLLDSFTALGPLAPILLAAVESLVPPLPLVAIVTINVAGHGPFWGFLYSWLGNCLGSSLVFLFFRLVLRGPFARWAEKNAKIAKARAWVNQVEPISLFLLALLPFTPSSFLNFAFGVSGFDPRRYLGSICSAKLIMIALLALFGQSFVQAVKNPLFLILAIGLLVALSYLSKKVRQKYGL